MRTICSREIFTKKCLQQQIFDSDLKGAWHYNHVTFTPIAKNFMLYWRLIYMLSILCVRLTINVKVGLPESFKVGWYPPKKTGSSHLKLPIVVMEKFSYHGNVMSYFSSLLKCTAVYLKSSERNGRPKLEGFVWEKQLLPPRRTLKWFSIQTLLN